MPHHRYEKGDKIHFFTEQEINKICRLKKSEINEVLNLLKNRDVNYLIVNHDLNNKNVKNSCIEKQLPEKIHLYPDVFDIAYRGEFLALVKGSFWLW